MNINFYNEQDFRYVEVGTILGVSNGKAKVYLNSITPTLSSDSPIKTKHPKKSTEKILNKGAKSLITACTTANYITMKLPSYIKVSKGDKVLVVFPGGEINEPRIIGEY